MAMKRVLTLGGGHTTQYTDDVLQHCMLETYVILLTHVTTINLIKIIMVSPHWQDGYIFLCVHHVHFKHTKVCKVLKYLSKDT